jgi:hypothetical protein
MATTTPTPSIEQLWEQLSSSPTPAAFTQNQLEQLHGHSNDSLRLLRRSIRINSGYTIVFGIAWLFLFIAVDAFWVRFCFGIMVAAHIAGLFYNSWLLRRVLPTPPADLHIKNRLQAIHLRMQQALRGTEWVALFFYPVSITAGFTLALWEADKLHLLGTELALQLLLLGSFVVLVPLCYLLTRYLHRVAYGKQLATLRALLEAFEEKTV